MKRLVFLVEGDTEVILVNNHIIPYLYSCGFKNPMNAHTIFSNRWRHSTGGNISEEYFANDVKRRVVKCYGIVT